MVIKCQMSPGKKTRSVIFSYLILFPEVLLMDRKDKMLLLINKIVATEVHSLINVISFNFKTFKEVNAKKQIPSKLAEVFKM